MKSEKAKGVASAIAAYLMWGVLPVYWKILGNVSAAEVLSHRIIWSFAFVSLIILVTRQWESIQSVLADRRQTVLLAVASVMIATNWGLFIWAVQTNHILESSLGYYINPLVAVLLGVVIFKEKLDRWQILAIGMASVGVAILVIEFGQFPWLSFTLAITFGIYGALKKLAKATSIVGLAMETAFLIPVALGYVLYLGLNGRGAWGGTSTTTLLLLTGAGVVTVIPLLLFAEGAKRIPLSTLGITQYIAPTLMFLLGILVYHERFRLVNAISFGFIWLALVIYTVSQADYFKKKRVARQAE